MPPLDPPLGKNNGIQKQLNKINRLALTYIANIRQNTPTAGLEIITGTPPSTPSPLNSNQNYLRLEFKTNWTPPNRNKQHLSHILFLEKFCEKLPHYNTPQDKIINTPYGPLKSTSTLKLPPLPSNPLIRPSQFSPMDQKTNTITLASAI